MQCDVLIQGGTVIDPSQGIYGLRDVAVSGDRIVALEAELLDCEAAHVIDARGLLVVPGLIDLHMHAYTHSPFGLDPDSLCAAGGVTTMLDAGTAGSYNFSAFRRDGIDQTQTQVLALVNLSCIGLVAANLGELLDPRYADPNGVVEIIRANSDVAVGVKIRAGSHIIGTGEQGWENLRAAIRAARDSATWLMVHIGECPMSIPELADSLAPGDCITHCFKGGSTRVTDDSGRIFPEVKEAAERGVIFDVGHGFGSFKWDVLQAALDDDFEPTTISTDLHTKNIHGPVYDMPTTMSKFLLLGTPIERVIEMSTTRPARVLNRADELGTLRVGTIADIAILEMREGEFCFTDSYQQTRVGEKLLVAATTVRRGEVLTGGGRLRMRHLA
ncbi:MAG: amidohydrolase/deacetylase family metallohydrolase [Planctomycetaceae bacterium]|nr:amidohydrolase/deacetylase family metallohydrolase [Planctomycetales bacterium]MCB9925456.1 amidohydrolase/deacetylase family metallohydrolase [Planctomycetaceae bacterium]